MFSRFVLALTFLSFVFIAPTRYDWDQVFLTGSLLSIIASGWLVEPYRDTRCRGLALLTIWAIITLGLDFQFYEMDTIIRVVLGVMAVKVIADKTNIDSYDLGKFLFFSNLAALAYLGLQLSNLDPWYKPAFQDMGSFFGKPWVMGSFAVISLPFLWRFRWWAIIPAIPLLYYSHSKLCVAVACLIALLLLPGKWKLIGLAFLPIAATAYAFLDGSGGGHRLAVWGNVWAYTEPYLLYGKGLGSFFHSAFAHSNGTELHHWPWLHNEFYQYLFEQGVPGLILLVGWYLLLFARTMDYYVRLSLIGIGLLCLFHPVMHFPKLIAACLLVIALAERGADSLSLRLPKGWASPFASASKRTCRTPR
jgi:hypothetical protein